MVTIPIFTHRCKRTAVTNKTQQMTHTHFHYQFPHIQRYVRHLQEVFLAPWKPTKNQLKDLFIYLIFLANTPQKDVWKRKKHNMATLKQCWGVWEQICSKIGFFFSNMTFRHVLIALPLRSIVITEKSRKLFFFSPQNTQKQNETSKKCNNWVNKCCYFGLDFPTWLFA